MCRSEVKPLVSRSMAFSVKPFILYRGKGHKAASPSHTDGSILFARLRQCATHVTHTTFGQTESTIQTASRSVQPFCTAHGRVSPSCGACHSPSKLLLSMIRGSLGPPDSASNRLLDRFSCSHNGMSLHVTMPPFPSKLSLPMKDVTPSNTWFLGPTQAQKETACPSVHPFLHGLRLSQTDRPTDHATRSVVIDRNHVRESCSLSVNNFQNCSRSRVQEDKLCTCNTVENLLPTYTLLFFRIFSWIRFVRPADH